MRKILFPLLLSMASLAMALPPLGQVFNSYTGNPDYINNLSSSSAGLLQDISTSPANNNDVLTYNSSTGKFAPKAPTSGGGGGSLSALINGSYVSVSSVQALGNVEFQTISSTWIIKVDLSSVPIQINSTFTALTNNYVAAINSTSTVLYTAINSTNTNSYLIVNSTWNNSIQLRSTLQSGSTFFTSSGTTNNFSASTGTFSSVVFHSTVATPGASALGFVQVYGSTDSKLCYNTPTGTRVEVSSIVPTGVTPGAYTNTNLTVDNFGRIVLAANGSAGSSNVLPLPGSATNYIQQIDTLQSGATFYTSSGTVNSFNAGFVKVSSAAGSPRTLQQWTTGSTLLAEITPSSISLSLPLTMNSPVTVTGPGNGVIQATSTVNNLTFNAGNSSMTMNNSSTTFNNPVAISSLNVTAALLMNSYQMFNTSQTITMNGIEHIIFSTATVLAGATYTYTPPSRCGTLVAPLSVFPINSAVIGAGQVEIGAYNFGDATIPYVNRDATDSKNIGIMVLCR